MRVTVSPASLLPNRFLPWADCRGVSKRRDHGADDFAATECRVVELDLVQGDLLRDEVIKVEAPSQVQFPVDRQVALDVRRTQMDATPVAATCRVSRISVPLSLLSISARSSTLS